MSEGRKTISPGMGALTLIVGVFFVSWASILIRLSESSPTTIAFFRMFFSSLMVLLAVPFYRGKWFERRADFWISTLSGIFLGLHFYTWIASLKFTSISSSVVLVTTQPVFVALLGFVFLKEKIGRVGSAAIILAIIGSYLIARGDLDIGAAHLKGDILALVGALMAGSYLFIGRFVRPRVNLIPYVLTVYSVASIVILILGLFSGTFTAPAVKIDYLIFFLLALGPTILGHNLYNFALRHLPAFPVAMSIIGEPVLATIWGMIILGENPIFTTIIGGAIIILAVVMVLSRLKTPQVVQG
ncbi:MAG: DMT family transporter [Candidatus Zixiibacteriota bacterium]|nr:MAG: DMT family transporter [candidate division Zixibacteria bacterium]